MKKLFSLHRFTRIFLLMIMLGCNHAMWAAKDTIYVVELTSDDFSTIPTMGGTCKKPTFTQTKGSPAWEYSDYSAWYKYDEGNNRLVEKAVTDVFEAGTYQYIVLMIVSGDDAKTYKLDNTTSLKVNGEQWTNYRSFNSSTQTYVYFTSPSITIVNTGIKPIGSDRKPAVRYNLKGQRVPESYKGVVVINGEKIIVK